MKKIICILTLFVSAISLNAQSDSLPKKDPTKYIQLTNEDYDMGKIPFGKPLEYNVYIKNISLDTLIIEDVRPVCGCTTPKFKTADKIFPGQSTFITLGFNGSTNGAFSKFADIIFKGGLTVQVKFKGVAVTDSPNQVPKIQ